MEYSLIEQAKIRLRQYHLDDNNEIVFDDLEENIILDQLISDAWNKIKNRRYNGHSENEIEKDFEVIQKTYENIALDVALYNYIKEGADFEKSNSVSGVTRNYISEDEILCQISPLVKVL